MDMRKLFLLLVLLLLVQPVLGYRGVGITYGTDYMYVEEDSINCLNYGVYNPWDEDVNIEVVAEDDLADMVMSIDPVFVSAGTKHDEATEVDVCFRVPELFEKDCLLGPILCKPICPVEDPVLSGNVVVREAEIAGISGTGSRATISASAPLRLIGKCEDVGRNWTPLLLIIIAVIAAIAGGAYALRQRQKPASREKLAKEYSSLREKMERLQKQMKE